MFIVGILFHHFGTNGSSPIVYNRIVSLRYKDMLIYCDVLAITPPGGGTVHYFFSYSTCPGKMNHTFGSRRHVAKSGEDSQEGSLLRPFLSIFQAVQFAMPGDTITVHAGTYREWVNPIRGGESELRRIVYRATPGEKVEIKVSAKKKDQS